jgi:alpha-glucosidase
LSELSTLTPGAVQGYRRAGRSLILECGGPQVAITVLTPRIIRVRLATEGAFLPRRSWAAVRSDEDFAETPFEVEETGQQIHLRTEVVTVRIERDSCRVAFAHGTGETFCADEDGMLWGNIPHTDAMAYSLGADSVACIKRIAEGEHFYGFGERTGMLDKLGQRLTNWTVDPPMGHGPGTDPLYMAIPVCMLVRPGLAYGVFFNNTWHSRFDIGRERPGTWKMEAAGGELDYYLLYGPTPAEVLAQVGELLGRMPLPPRWALGYHQSRWSYETEADMRALAADFRNRDIPCDVIHFDIDYMDGYRVFTWDAQRFPDPAGLLADLRRDHFHAVAIIDPGVKADPDYQVYQDGLERDMFVRKANGEVFHGYVWPDDAVFSDYTRPDVRHWWGDQQKVLLDQGISGIWNDMNEPTSFERPFSEGFSPAGTIDLDAVQGPADEQTVHAEVHNLYGSGMAQACYEGLRRHLGGERPFVLTRSAYAGIQCWSAGWMGDNLSWWEHLEMSMPQLMNMGLSGVPFVGVDIGGFFGNATGEMFARWMQLGAFYPFCRGHTALRTERHEPWVFGPEVEQICRDYLKLRYRLLPYLYTLFWEASQQSAPLLRPLFYHFPDDPKTYQLHDQVMVGPALLAAPIYQPGREHRAVYLPAGEWYDWWTEEVITGPTHLLAHAPLERMPLYVRAGAIIPSGPEMNYTAEKPLDPLTLDLYPGEGAFTLYEDDGRTFAHEQGEFCTTSFRLSRNNAAQNPETALHGHAPHLTLEIGAREGTFTPSPRQLRLRVHAVDHQAAAVHPDAQYDADRRILTLQLADDGSAHRLEFKL